MKHPRVALRRTEDWELLDGSLGRSIRMIRAARHCDATDDGATYNLSDEVLCVRWVENRPTSILCAGARAKQLKRANRAPTFSIAVMCRATTISNAIIVRAHIIQAQPIQAIAGIPAFTTIGIPAPIKARTTSCIMIRTTASTYTGHDCH